MKKSCSGVKPPQMAHCAFSLVEMLMALLVASLLMAALAPVMTRKMGENIGISVEGSVPGKKEHVHKITYQDCLDSGGVEKTNADGSKYCEGEFIVPVGYNGTMTVTAIGAGGGGGTAATAGYTEFNQGGTTSPFTVPYMVNQIEATLVSGGAGGGAGGQALEELTFPVGISGWPLPQIVRGKTVLVSGCGAGGGGGGGGWEVGGAGGNGGMAFNIPFFIPAATDYYIVGVGSGGGVGASCGKNLHQAASAPGPGTYDHPSGGGGGACGGYNQAVAFQAAGNGGTITSTSCTILNTVIEDGNVGQGGTGATPDPNMLGCTSPGMGGSWHYGFGGGGGGGLSAGIYNGIGMAAHGGGGGGSSTGIGDWFTESNIIFSGGGGGGGAARGGGGGAGGGLHGGGGGGGGIEYFSGLPGMDIAVGIGGVGGNGAGNGQNGGRNSGGRGGDGGWAYGGNSSVGSLQANHAYDSKIFPGKCLGGAADKKGQDGALKVSYLSYGPGGGGGGGGTIVPIQKEPVIAGEILNVKVGRGSKGGTAGYMSSNGTIAQNTSGEDSTYNTIEPGNAVTKIIRTSNNTMLFATCHGDAHWCGPLAGSPDGGVYYDNPHYGKGGGAHTNNTTDYGSPIAIKGFSGTSGKSANNGTSFIYGTDKANFPNGSTGGDGGSVTIFKNITCTPGAGGTASNPKGGNASGYGCGGGGGYGLADGGAGSGGYVRISWNKYWNPEKTAYDLANTGAGGGGASGNAMEYAISVSSGEKIKYRIGKGGDGAYIIASNQAELSEAKSGGDTIFAYGTSKAVKAGGGGNGASPRISDNNSTIINGTGGNVSNICHMNNTPYESNTKYCKKGNKGEYPIEAKGGKGASLSTYGTGGSAKAQGRGDTSGGNGTGYGAGGAGGSLKDLDKVSASEAIANPTKGGDGADGAIILKWYE